MLMVVKKKIERTVTLDIRDVLKQLGVADAQLPEELAMLILQGKQIKVSQTDDR